MGGGKGLSPSPETSPYPFAYLLNFNSMEAGVIGVGGGKDISPSLDTSPYPDL